MTDVPTASATLVVDCATGEVQTTPLSPDDAASLAAFQQSVAAAAQVTTTATANRQTMADRASQAIQNLLAAADALDANTASAAQQRAALALCCRTCARLVRITLNELDQAT